MEKTKRMFNATGAVLLLTFMVIGLSLILDNFTNRTMGLSAYPAPDNGINSPLASTQIQILDPPLATEIAQKLQYTPSQAELSLIATDTYRRFLLITPPPTATPIKYLVRSIDDIVNVVLSDPFFGDLNQGDFGPCLKANTPGKAFFVRSLQAGWPDYYVLPFFQNDKVCGV